MLHIYMRDQTRQYIHQTTTSLSEINFYTFYILELLLQMIRKIFVSVIDYITLLAHGVKDQVPLTQCLNLRIPYWRVSLLAVFQPLFSIYCQSQIKQAVHRAQWKACAECWCDHWLARRQEAPGASCAAQASVPSGLSPGPSAVLQTLPRDCLPRSKGARVQQLNYTNKQHRYNTSNHYRYQENIVNTQLSSCG